MFKELFLFEIEQKRKQPVVWLFFVLLFIIGLAAISSEARVGLPLGNEFRNSPYRIFNLIAAVSVFLGTLVVAAIMASTAVKDYHSNYYQIMFSAPLQKFQYLAGRFLGAVVGTLMPFIGFLLGIFLGQFMPWIPAERLGPIVPMAYFQSFIIFVLPMIFSVGAILFTVATLTKKQVYAYVVVTAMILGYFLTLNFIARNADLRFALSFVDPFGLTSLSAVSRYWSIAEKNTMILSFSEGIMSSRLLWIGIGTLSLIFLYFRFSFALASPAKRARKTDNKAEKQKSKGFTFTENIHLPKVQTSFKLKTYWVQVFSQSNIEFRAILRSTPFLILTCIGLVNLLSSLGNLATWFSTPLYPETNQMLDGLNETYPAFLFVILIFYSGEIVWKERDARMHELFDATPFPNWVPFLSKTMGLLFIVVFYLLLGLGIAVLLQLGSGKVSIGWNLYFKDLFLGQLPNYLIMIVFAVFLQTVANNKYLGYLLFIMFTLIMNAVLSGIGWTHNLYSIGSGTNVVYSTMNGHGHYWTRMLSFRVYWLFFAAILAVASIQFWIRGANPEFKHRLRVARQSFSMVLKTVLLVSVLGFVSMGCYIFYNTNVLNSYATDQGRSVLRAEYERKYFKYADIAQPDITDQKIAFDIFPYKKKLRIKGTYTLTNKSKKTIDSLHLNLNARMNVKTLTIAGAKLVHNDPRHSYRIYHLGNHLKPKQTIRMSFEVLYEVKGFENEISSDYFGGFNTNQLVENGTFFSGNSVLPHIGFSRAKMLTGDNERLEQGLKPQPSLPDVNDPKGAMESYIDLDGDWVKSDFVVSTTADQVAIAPGKLLRQWSKNGRKYFHYQPMQPIRNTIGVLSGKYKVKRQKWGDVDMEVYYHPTHGYNVDRMMKSIRNSLQYYSQNFSPYQFKYARVIEFPGYAEFAQAFPGTMPYSENAGFVANLEGKDVLDITYYVVAHEMSHQWWGHQTLGSRTQGASIMSETLAQYSALTLMEKEYGKEKMQRFLKFELDGYLSGRARETKAEQPLLYNDYQQYIHYRKGSLVMYALKDFIGEKKINSALSKFVKATAYKEPPYPNSLEFFKYLEEVTPDSLNYLLDDWFKKITMYENKATSAKYRKMKNGKYAVYLTTSSQKDYLDGKGNPTSAKLNEWINLGVYGEDDKLLYYKRVKIDKAVNEFEIIVDKKPTKAGIDPLHLYIDRSSANNTIRAEEME